jgi:O-antigen/teichoic acid export membrane protein
MRRHVTDAFWVVGGTALTAVGTVAGIRILTQFLAPEAYGLVSLALGLSTLAISLVATPLTQAAIHFYPVLNHDGSAAELLFSLKRCFRRIAPWLVAGAAASAAIYVLWAHGSPVLVVILVLLLASDCWRSANLSLLNAARRHTTYALWVVGDAWLRPLIAVLAVLLLGKSPTVVLGAYLAVSLALMSAFSRQQWVSAMFSATRYSPEQSGALDSRMWTYALPLVPLGVIAWVANLGDRYIIGAVLSVADVGVYAAVYGLASAPFMMAGGTAELALRPVHQAAVANGDQQRAQKIFRLWLATVTCVCAMGVLIFAVGHRFIADLLVGKSYRYASGLMPWIGLGYAIRAASYVFERMCYAHGQTRSVLAIQSCGVLGWMVATPLGALTLGLKGAALAVPVNFFVQLAAAVVLSRRAARQSSTGGAGDNARTAVADA